MQRRALALTLSPLAIVVLIASGCGTVPFKSPESAPAADTRGIAPAAPAGPAGAVQSAPALKGAAAAPEAAARAAPGVQQQTSQAPPIDLSQRLIVRSANLVLMANDVSEMATQARVLADSVNGFVVNSIQREESGKPAATVTIRVPAERFEEVMDKLKAGAARVNNEQVSSRDVTEEFVDTDARLRNLRATEERYLTLLQQARSVEDILKVEQQLSNIRGQIEQLQGRLQFLQRSAETSLITVEIRPYAAAQSPIGDWSLLPVVSNAWAALLSTMQLLVAGLVWALVFSPIWLPIGFLAWRWRRRGAARALPARSESPTVSA
jgi:hypothetical protein